MVKSKVGLTLVALAQFVALSAFADSGSDKEKEDREVCFNMLCQYRADNKPHADGVVDGKYDTCRSAATFVKWVKHDGGEIEDKSDQWTTPEFQVECDGWNIFNNSANRVTDHLGTRIQAVAGPYPATLLPKGALKDGRRYVVSSLELENQKLRGYCYIYTGPYLAFDAVESFR